ncbi:hypothetical protein [Bradyrhizobium stylosanthis]|uniref:hypothetical protein n=1 Tax=Bradyrhizobium stylosanthis TaxID=1803665 RepID=UPI00119DDBFB|nr:hypothetical protein [Bradyrhizobium stylosanthis]
MTELDGDCGYQRPAQHRKTAGSIKKKRRLRINREYGAPNKPSEPDQLFASGNDGTDQNYSCDCALNARGPDTIRTPT